MIWASLRASKCGARRRPLVVVAAAFCALLPSLTTDYIAAQDDTSLGAPSESADSTSSSAQPTSGRTGDSASEAEPPRSDGDTVARRQQAHELLLRSREHYNAGRFVTAADILDEAYSLYPEPTLLFNAARAYENAGRSAQALDRYERYLVEVGEDAHIEDRQAIERRVAVLRRQAAAQGDREPGELESTISSESRVAGITAFASDEETPGRSLDLAPWLVAGIGAAGLATGAIFGAIADNSYESARESVSHGDAARLQQEAFDLATAANVAFIVGGAMVLTGVIWGIVDVATVAEHENGQAALASGSYRLELGIGHVRWSAKF